MVALHEESENRKLECDICDSGDPPANRCTTCSYFLCAFCTQAHQRARNTRSHNLVSVEGSAAVTKSAVCKEHDGEVIKLFCNTCEEAICRDCTIVEHRDHKYTFVKDAFSKGKESLLKALADTKEKADVLEKAVKGVLEMKRSVHSCANQTKQEVVECCDELTDCIAARKTYLVDRVEEFKKAKLKSLDVQQEQLEKALASVQSSVQFTEKAVENGSEVEILNTRKQIFSQLQDLKLAKWQLEPCVNESLSFTGNGHLKEDISTFGIVSDVVTDAGMSTVTMENGPEGVMYSSLCGQPVKFRIIAKESNGRRRKEGGDIFKAFVNTANPLRSQVKQIPVKDCGNGTYSFCHTPMETGFFELSVQLKGSHIRESPFQWSVRDQNSLGELILCAKKLTAKYSYKGDGDYVDDDDDVNDDDDGENGDDDGEDGVDDDDEGDNDDEEDDDDGGEDDDDGEDCDDDDGEGDYDDEEDDDDGGEDDDDGQDGDDDGEDGVDDDDEGDNDDEEDDDDGGEDDDDGEDCDDDDGEGDYDDEEDDDDGGEDDDDGEDCYVDGEDEDDDDDDDDWEDVDDDGEDDDDDGEDYYVDGDYDD